MSFEYWYMFPIAIVVATTAMASGVGGATFFAPIFILGLGFPAEVAIGTGLITEVFGFASGLIAYARKRLIDYKLGAALLVATIPAAILGTILAGWVDPEILKAILGVGLFAIAISFLRVLDHEDVAHIDSIIAQANNAETSQTKLVTAEGKEFFYTVCNKFEGRLIVGVGGLFVGLISTGLGELNSYFLLQRCKVPSPVAIATSVFVVAVTALTAATGHFVQFIQLGDEVLQQVFSLVIFTVPGVIIGGQFGSYVAARIPQKVMERTLGVLFILVAILTLWEVIN